MKATKMYAVVDDNSGELTRCHSADAEGYAPIFSDMGLAHEECWGGETVIPVLVTPIGEEK